MRQGLGIEHRFVGWLVRGMCAFAWIGGCGGSGSLEGEVYRGSQVTYEIGHLGSHWERIHVDGRTDAAWGHEHLASVIQVNSSCNPELDIPLDALTRHLTIGFTEREIESQDRIPMAAREALRTHLRAKLDGVPRELMFVVLKKNGCVYDFVLIAPPDQRFDRARQDYAALIEGFRARGGVQ